MVELTTTFLKKSNRASPTTVRGKKVMEVSRGQEKMDTSAMPKIMEPRTLSACSREISRNYICGESVWWYLQVMSNAVKTPPSKKPSHIVGLVALWLRQAPVSGSRY